MKQGTRTQKLLKLNKETVKKLDENALRAVIGGDSPVKSPVPQKIHE